MGEPVAVGLLTYTVIGTEWLDHVGDTLTARLPRNRFLAVRVSVANSGSRRSAIPMLELLDGKGETYREISDAHGLPEWFGTLRSLGPSESQQGTIVFDVPAGSYRLRVAEDADPEEQRTAVVDLPYQLPPVVPQTAAGKLSPASM